MKTLVVIIGASGSGKTTVGGRLARVLGVPFADADDLHSDENVTKMAAGVPLTDDDRWPWLRRVGGLLSAARSNDTGLVIACSALKRSYRDAIIAAEPQARFVLLCVPRDVLARRMMYREGHFMPSSLLDSQLAMLEPLQSDERGVTISNAEPIDDVVATIIETLRGESALSGMLDH